MSPERHAALAAILLLAASQPGAAYEIYKWTDENGVVHYSESLPEQVPEAAETLYIEPTNPPGYDPEDDYWSITNQAARINAEWTAIQQEKEKDLALQRALEAEQRLAELEAQLAAHKEPHYVAFPPIYHPIIRAKHRQPPFVGVHNRVPHAPTRQPPHHSRDHEEAPASRPGWSAPHPPARPSTPGFRASESP